MNWAGCAGRTVAGAFLAGDLVRAEAQSAFFLATDPSGRAGLLRLTETQGSPAAEVLENWRKISALASPHLQRLESFGQTEVDGVPVLYAWLESPDSSLAELVETRVLTPDEATGVADALIEGLRALHDRGLMHGRLVPAAVLAMGEDVKLRSDCARAFSPDRNPDAEEAGDIAAVASVLLRALTPEPGMYPDVLLPAPFDRIVAHGLDGTWGLEEMRRALHPELSPPTAPPPASVLPEPVLKDTSDGDAPTPNAALTDETKPARSARARVLLAAGVLSLLCGAGLAALFGAHRGPNGLGTVAAPPFNPAAAPPVNDLPALPPGAPPRKVIDPRSGWFVVVYRFDRADVAVERAAELTQQHPELKPQYYSPTGRAPFLVVVGGSMSESQAEKMWIRARQIGLPNDIYIGRNGQR